MAPKARKSYRVCAAHPIEVSPGRMAGHGDVVTGLDPKGPVVRAHLSNGTLVEVRKKRRRAAKTNRRTKA